MRVLWIPQYYDMNHALSRRTFKLAGVLYSGGTDVSLFQEGFLVAGNKPPVFKQELCTSYLDADIVLTKRLDESIFDRTKAKVILDWNDGDIGNCSFLHKYAAIVAGCKRANEVIFNGKAEVIEFPVEGAICKGADYTWHNKVVWMGASPEWSKETIDYLREKGFEVMVIGPMSSSLTTDLWDINTWEIKCASADVAIIPYPPKGTWKYIENKIRIETKDNEKAAEFMSLGLPTIVAPLDSYSFIEQGWDGFFADNKEDFLTYVNMLESIDESDRRDVGVRAREKALELFSYDVIAQKYKKLFDKVLGVK